MNPSFDAKSFWGLILMIVLTMGCARLAESSPSQADRAPLSGKNPVEERVIPRFSHVIIIIFENTEFSQIIGNSRLRWFNVFSRDHTLLTRYYAVTHPSLPNYLALISGETFGIESDCTDCFVDARSLPDLLEAAGRTWKTYLEGMPYACFKGVSSGRYAIKHNPFLYFNAIREDQARCRRSIVPLSQLGKDLKEGDLPDFAFIVPDMCHSSHDCSLKISDSWLGRIARSILDSPVFDQNSLLVVTFDEGTTNEGCCGPSPQVKGGRIATLLISALAKKGFKDSTVYSHYSLLKTIAAAWDLEELGHSSDPETNLISAPWKNRIPEN
jgi:hypothetical protein